MPDSMTTEDAVIRIAALKAAKDAAEHVAKTTSNRSSSSVGAFALYTWGSLAFVSALFAAFVSINPDNLTLQPQTVAKFERLLDQTVANVQELTDTASSALFALAPVETSGPKVVELAGNTAEPVEDIQILPPRPELPKIELPNINLPDTTIAVTNRAETPSGELDNLSTGSINVEPEEELQAFPEDVLPREFFAVDIGGATAVSPLIGRYAALKRRAPDLFMELEPRIQLKGADESLEARLIAGPFTSRTDVAHFCRSLRLRLTIDCSLSTFEGDTIQ